MEPWEVMTSESQERMLAIVRPDSWPAVAAICEKWEVRATVIGTVTEPEPDGGGRLRIRDGMDGPVLADVPAASLSDDAPLYDRPRQAPVPGALRRLAPAPPADCAADLLALLRSPRWVYRQYDHQLFLNTVAGPGADAALLAAGRARPAALVARGGAQHRLEPAGVRARPARRHGTGAGRGRRQPGLRRGHAGRGGELPQLREPRTPRGDVAALRVHRRHGGRLPRPRGCPVIGGNVSFYNESGGADIDPTPVLGVLGLVDALHAPPPGPRHGPRATRSCCSGPRRRAAVRRRRRPAPAFPLEGTRWATERRGHRTGAGAPPWTSPRTRRSVRSWPGMVAAQVGGGRAGGGCAGARRARRLGRWPGRRPGRDGGRGRRRLRARLSTTPPSCSPSCRRGSWSPPATPTGCAPGRAPPGSPPRSSDGPAATGSASEPWSTSPLPPSAPPTRATWARPWATRDDSGLCDNEGRVMA